MPTHSYSSLCISERGGSIWVAKKSSNGLSHETFGRTYTVFCYIFATSPFFKYKSTYALLSEQFSAKHRLKILLIGDRFLNILEFAKSV